MTQPIPAVKRAFPCGVTFEFNPLRSPYSDFFEQALEFDVGVSVFHEFPQIAPMQYFDIQQIETWDDLVDFPGQSEILLANLQQRALDPMLRYLPLSRQISFRSDSDQRPGIVRGLAQAAETVTSERLKQIAAGQP
jgi:hypothetical protein